MSMTDTPRRAETAGSMAATVAAIGRALDQLDVIPHSIAVTAERITLQVRGGDLDVVADNYWAGDPRRYASNIERRGEFGDIPLTVFAGADEYDAARNCCKACGQTVPAVSE